MIETQIPDVVQIVRDRLEKINHEHHIELKLEDRDYRLEDDWLYLVVTPSLYGVSAFDYSKLLTDIEKDLRSLHFDNVLIVPAIEE